MNTWMNNPQYLAQVGHFLGGLSLMLLATLAAIIWGHGAITMPGAVFDAIIVAAGLKEFWYDMKYELPKQTWGDSITDFAFYMFGGGVGLGVAGLTLHGLQSRVVFIG